jgi:hypothetical protein
MELVGAEVDIEGMTALVNTLLQLTMAGQAGGPNATA